MGRSSHLILALALMCRMGISETPSNGSPGFLPLRVLLFNYAPGYSPKTITGAQAIASQIFHRDGIELSWVDCSLLQDGTSASLGCTAPFEPTTIILRLVPTSPATKLRFGRDTLGIAAQAEEGTFASASVFHDRIDQLAKGWLVPSAVVLGHAMAHEVGHLLLGARSHSPSGLMRERWSRRDLTKAGEGNLRFNSRQAETIRAQVRERPQSRESDISRAPLQSPKHSNDPIFPGISRSR